MPGSGMPDLEPKVRDIVEIPIREPASILKGCSDFLRFLYSLSNRAGFLKVPRFQAWFARSYFLYKKHLEDPYGPLVQSRPELFRGGHILDIGANIGYTSVLFSEVVTPGFWVSAFEPEEANFNLLRRSLYKHGVSDAVRAVHAAAGAKPGTAALWINPGHHGDHRIVTPGFAAAVDPSAPQQIVEMVQIDDFWLHGLQKQPVRFIKVDVQGFEEDVCLGMTQTLADNPEAAVALEYCPEAIRSLGFDPNNLLNFFHARDYQAHRLDRWRGLRECDYEEIAKKIDGHGAYMDLLFIRT